MKKLDNKKIINFILSKIRKFISDRDDINNEILLLISDLNNLISDTTKYFSLEEKHNNCFIESNTKCGYCLEYFDYGSCKINYYQKDHNFYVCEGCYKEI